MPIGTDYEPEYVQSLDDVPISGPDEYEVEAKRKALFHAETQLELDVNEGDPIPQDQVVDSHRLAAVNLATHVLTHAAEDPKNVTLGDMADGGGTITEYSSRYLEAYNQLVDRMVSSGVAGSQSDNFAVVVNNGTVGDNATTRTS